VAAAGAALFLDALLAHGTTSAVVFPTVHQVSVDALFGAAQARGMRLIAGKVLMDRHAPEGPGRRGGRGAGRTRCVDLIQRWHGRGRCSYAVTVRFAPTSTPAQLAMAGSLCKADPTLYLQTHVAENEAEVRWVGRAVPRGAQLPRRLRPPRPAAPAQRAGAWHLARRRRPGAAARQRCPDRLLPQQQPVPGQWPVRLGRGPRRPCAGVSVASDVGGGTSLSMQRTLADGYKVQALRGTRLNAFSACTRPRWARPGRWAWRTRSGTWARGRHGRPGAVGLGPHPRPPTSRSVICTSRRWCWPRWASSSSSRWIG
jgi:guanine deaminase